MNTQEKVEELGSGHYTALFWEYDSRTGRRWNIDPVMKFGESPYATFSNNPIVNNDPNGDTDGNPQEGDTKQVPSTVKNAPPETMYYHAGGISTATNEITKAGWYSEEKYKLEIGKYVSYKVDSDTKEIQPYISGTLQTANLAKTKIFKAAVAEAYNRYTCSNEILHLPNECGEIVAIPTPYNHGRGRGLDETLSPLDLIGSGFGKLFTKGITKILSKGGVEFVETAAKGGTKLLTQFSSSTIDDAVGLVMKDPNKVAHLFPAKHNLGSLVTKLGGQENTVRSVLNAANGKLPSSGMFNNIPVNVGGSTVFIRGNVVNGVPRLGTMFIP